MNNVCPECGGILNGDRCQFCGAVIIDMASINRWGNAYYKSIELCKCPYCGRYER